MNNAFIVGENIYLRPLEMSDLEACMRWVNDAEITRHLLIGSFPINRYYEEEWLRNSGRGNSEITLAICRVKDNAHIGNAGLHQIDYVHRYAKIGLFIGEKEHWGRGYGGETMRLLINHAFRALNMNRVELEVHATNERAIKCYKKLGFVEEGRLRHKLYKNGEYIDELLMSVLRDEWNE